MEMLQLGRMVRRWAWLVVLFLVIAGVTAAAVSIELPRVYQTTTTALVNPKQVLLPGTDTGSSLSTDQLVQTYVELINATPVHQKLIADGVPRTPDELAHELQPKVRGTTTLIDITVSDRDPQVAQRIAEDIIPAFNDSLAQFQANVTGPTTHAPQLDALVPWQVPATAPTSPVSPKPALNIALALAAALVLGVGVAFTLEYLDNTVKTELDVGTKLALPLLGPIIYQGKTRLGRFRGEPLALVTETHPKEPVAEGYRAIRTNLLFTSVDKPLKTLVVTSAAPGEGKTSTACNIAVTIAQAGNKVVLIDADFRRPALHKVFKRLENVGLGDVILGTMTLEEALTPTNTENLLVLCSGPTPPNPSELLGSDRMLGLLEKLREEADMVVIDSPPVGAVTDATILGARCDGVVLVVERGRTEINTVVRARDKLQVVGARILGVVLNKVRASETSGFYYYKYYTAQATAAKQRGGRERPSRRPRPAAAPAPTSALAAPVRPPEAPPAAVVEVAPPPAALEVAPPEAPVEAAPPLAALEAASHEEAPRPAPTFGPVRYSSWTPPVPEGNGDGHEPPHLVVEDSDTDDEWRETFPDPPGSILHSGEG